MNIYLDNCCYNRPFDDQSSLRILLESEAKLRIQENIRSGIYSLIWSYILDYENSKNPYIERRQQILKWQKYSSNNIEADETILKSAKNIMACGIKTIDSLHIACAIKGNAEYFMTTDDGIIKKATLVNNIRIIDPITFIKEVAL